MIQSPSPQVIGTQHQVITTPSPTVGNSPVLIPINQQPPPQNLPPQSLQPQNLPQNVPQQNVPQQNVPQQNVPQQQPTQFHPLSMPAQSTSNNANTAHMNGHGITTMPENKSSNSTVNGICDKGPSSKGMTSSGSSSSGNGIVTVTSANQARPLATVPQIIEEEVPLPNHTTGE